MRRLLLTIAFVAALLPSIAFAESPPWPDDLFAVHVVPVASGPEGAAGYWVWDPYHFAGGSGTSHFWTPRWVWVTADGTLPQP